MSTRQISLNQFATHCTEEIASAQRDHTVLEILGADGPVALLSPLPPKPTGTLADWIGSGAGLVTFAPGHDPDEPAFAPEEWENFPHDPDDL